MKNKCMWMGLVLVLALLVNILPVQVLAMETIYVERAVTGVAEPVAGQEASFDTIGLPEGAEGYYISSITWKEYDAQGKLLQRYGQDFLWGYVEGEAFTFRDDCIYAVTFGLEVKAPEQVYYAFSEAPATVNGYVVDEIFCEGNSVWANVTYWFGNKTISQVALQQLPAPQAGQEADFAGIAPDTSAEHYGIASITWRQTDASGNICNEYTQLSGGETLGEPFTFREGCAYSLCVTFQTEEGYLFSDRVRPYIGQEDFSLLYAAGNQCQLVRTWRSQTLGQTQLVQPEVEGVLPPASGEKATFEGICVPEHAQGYYLEALEWIAYDQDGNYAGAYGWQLAGDTLVGEPMEFQDGYWYELRISIAAMQGYIFNRNDEMYHDRRVIVNGAPVDPVHSYVGETTATASYYFGYVPLEGAQITGVTKPQVGQLATFDGIAISEGSIIESMVWIEYDANGNITSNEWKTSIYEYECYGEAFAFREGYTYALSISVIPELGGMFYSQSVITVDAQAPSRVDPWQNRVYVDNLWQADGTPAVAIEKAELQITPVFGQTTSPDMIQVPGGYRVCYVVWYELDPNGQVVKEWYTHSSQKHEGVQTSGAPFVFRRGYSYMVQVSLIADTGSYFRNMSQVLVNGVLAGHGELDGSSLECGVRVAVQEPPEEKPDPDINPPTGDAAGMLLAGLMAGALGMTVLIPRRRKWDES